MKRVDVINRIGDLTEQKCQPCENSGGNHSSEMCASCSVYKELRQLGDQLNGMAGSKKKAAEILAKGEMITWKDVDQLIELDVPKKTIIDAMGMSESEFFKSQRERGMKVEPITTKQPTKKAYMKLKEERVSDSKIAKRYGMTPAQMTAWRKENLTEEEQEQTRLKKGAKNAGNGVLEPENTKGQEAESNATGEALEASNEPIVKLKAEYENQMVVSKLKESYKAEIENEVKEQIRHLAAENKQLHGRNENLEKLNADITCVLEMKNYEIDQLRNIGKDKDAEIGALQSNNEDLHATIDRLKEEMTHVKRELRLATEEVDAVRTWTPQLAQIAEPIRAFPDEMAMERVDEEKEALRTLVKLWA